MTRADIELCGVSMVRKWSFKSVVSKDHPLNTNTGPVKESTRFKLKESNLYVIFKVVSY